MVYLVFFRCGYFVFAHFYEKGYDDPFSCLVDLREFSSGVDYGAGACW